MLLEDIQSVELIHYPEVKQGAKDKAGLALTAMPETFAFNVDVKDVDANVVVPNDPQNTDYRTLRVWYAEQKKKPFDFTFIEDPTPNHAATAEAAPVPQQKPTDPIPDAAAAGPNLTRSQVKEIDAERAETVKRGTAGQASIGS